MRGVGLLLFHFVNAFYKVIKNEDEKLNKKKITSRDGRTTLSEQKKMKTVRVITAFTNTNKIKLGVLLNGAFHMKHSKLATLIFMVHNTHVVPKVK